MKLELDHEILQLYVRLLLRSQFSFAPRVLADRLFILFQARGKAACWELIAGICRHE